MLGRLAVFALVALPVCAADLASKTLMQPDPWYDHARSTPWVVLSLVVLAATLALVRIPSTFVVVACGLLAGGVLGNLSWAIAHDGAVANPLVLELGDGLIAYNVADVFVLGGVLLATVALCAQAIKYRDVLPETTIATRLARRLRS